MPYHTIPPPTCWPTEDTFHAAGRLKEIDGNTRVIRFWEEVERETPSDEPRARGPNSTFMPLVGCDVVSPLQFPFMYCVLSMIDAGWLNWCYINHMYNRIYCPKG